MRKTIATVTAKGQVTIPAEVRKSLGLKPGDKLVFIFDQGAVKIEPSPSTLKLDFGAIKPRKKPEDFKQLRGKVQKWVAHKTEDKL